MVWMRGRTAESSKGAGLLKTEASFAGRYRLRRRPDHLLWFEHLSDLLSSGVDLRTTIAGAATTGERFSSIQRDAQFQLDSGRPLSEAFVKYVDSVTAHLFAVAEDAGVLDAALKAYVERERIRRAWRQRISKTLSYPVLLVIACYTLGIYVLVTVRPELAALEATVSSGGRPSGIQRLSSYLPLCLLTILTAIPVLYGVCRAFKSLTNIRFSLPFDPLLRRAHSERFVYGIYIQLRAGLSLIDALSPKSGVSNHQSVKEYEFVLSGVLGGLPLSQTLPDTLDPICRQFVQMGEQTGDMENALAKTCTYLKARIEKELDRISLWLEPAAMGVMGLVVASTMYSVFVPMYQSVGGMTVQ